MDPKNVFAELLGITIALMALAVSGCSTARGTGALAGAGIGTLIVNKPGYLVNVRYRADGTRMILDDPGLSAVLGRIPA